MLPSRSPELGDAQVPLPDYCVRMTSLFSPITLRDVTSRNRIFVAPMCQYACVEGMPNSWHLVHLGSRAVGGAGVIIAEATAVVPEGRISPGDVGLWNDAQTEAFQPITSFLREHGAVPAVQLAHAGRKASTATPKEGGGPLVPQAGGWTPVGPSARPFSPLHTTPHSMTASELDEVVESFVAAARRSFDAGFQAIEVHSAHGYLLHSFLSPLSNHREDEYGGALENRARLLLRVVDGVRAVWPERLPLFVRLSVTDWVEGGWDLEQSIELSRWLAVRGVDLIDCSSGGLTPDAVIPAAPGFQTPFATAVRDAVGIPTGAVGLITQPAQAEEVIATGLADIVLLGREMLRDPYWPLHAAHALGVDVPWPLAYTRAKPH